MRDVKDVKDMAAAPKGKYFKHLVYPKKAWLPFGVSVANVVPSKRDTLIGIESEDFVFRAAVGQGFWRVKVRRGSPSTWKPQTGEVIPGFMDSSCLSGLELEARKPQIDLASSFGPLDLKRGSHPGKRASEVACSSRAPQGSARAAWQELVDWRGAWTHGAARRSSWSPVSPCQRCLGAWNQKRQASTSRKRKGGKREEEEKVAGAAGAAGLRSPGCDAPRYEAAERRPSCGDAMHSGLWRACSL